MKEGRCPTSPPTHWLIAIFLAVQMRNEKKRENIPWRQTVKIFSAATTLLVVGYILGGWAATFMDSLAFEGLRLCLS